MNPPSPSLLSDPVLAQERGKKAASPHLRHAGDAASTQAGSPDHGVHILRAQNKYLKVEEGKKKEIKNKKKKIPALLCEQVLSLCSGI